MTNPAADQGGTYTDLEVGHYKYNFGTAMPTDVTPTSTLTLGAYARRTLTDIIGKDYYADNVLMDFRPDGAKADATWGAMAIAQHVQQVPRPAGPPRRNAPRRRALHAVPQQPGLGDTTSGETFDGKIFFHKLHNAANLPSGKPYIAGGDWSGMTYPQDIRNCTTCHDTTAAEGAIWMTRPTRAVCGSCHDNINWTTGANHPGGAAADDIGCPKCHIPDSGKEFDASIKGAHVIPTKSRSSRASRSSIVSVTNAAPGKTPTVVVQDHEQRRQRSRRLEVETASDRSSPARRRAQLGWSVRPPSRMQVFDPTAGTTTYTFTANRPGHRDRLGASSRATSIAPSRSSGTTAAPTSPFAKQQSNPLKYVAVTGTTVTPRRTAQISQAATRATTFSRSTVASATSSTSALPATTPATTDTATPPESVSFQRMIHRIHTGEALTQTYKIANAAYNEVLFPGDRRNCAKCHTSSGYALPLPAGIDAVTTPTDYFSPQGPGTAACLGCHDNVDAAAHAYLNTTNFGGKTSAEACATCHGTGKD